MLSFKIKGFHLSLFCMWNQMFVIFCVSHQNPPTCRVMACEAFPSFKCSCFPSVLSCFRPFFPFVFSFYLLILRLRPVLGRLRKWQAHPCEEQKTSYKSSIYCTICKPQLLPALPPDHLSSMPQWAQAPPSVGKAWPRPLARSDPISCRRFGWYTDTERGVGSPLPACSWETPTEEPRIVEQGSHPAPEGWLAAGQEWNLAHLILVATKICI